MRRLLFCGVVLVFSLTWIAAQTRPATPIKGVWRFGEIVNPQGEENPNPEPALYMFTARHYSFVRVRARRPTYTGPDVTDAQRVEMWGPYSATSGTYDIRGNVLTIYPVVAKNPSFMTEGKFMRFEVTEEGHDIWIRAIESDAGPISSDIANRVRLVRLE